MNYKINYENLHFPDDSPLASAYGATDAQINLASDYSLAVASAETAALIAQSFFSNGGDSYDCADRSFAIAPDFTVEG